MKTLCYALLSFTLMVGATFAQEETTTPRLKPKETAKIKAIRPKSEASSVITRQRAPEVIEADKIANRKVIKNIGKSEAAQLTRQTDAVKNARVKAGSPTPKKLTSSQINQLNKQTDAVKNARTKPVQPKGILKNANQPSAPSLTRQKGVQFNPKTQVKRIPNSPQTGLKSAPGKPLNKPYAKHGSLTTPRKVVGKAPVSTTPKAVKGLKTPPKSTLAKGASGTGKLKTLGKGAGVVAGGAIVAGGAMSLAEAKKRRDAGEISQTEYKKLQATNAVKIAGEAAKLKKLNPTALLLNDVIGTDPLSLGIEGIGDLINGTDNARQSVKNMENAWNSSLTRQTFTDPEAAAKRVGKDIHEAGQQVGEFGQKAGQTIGREARKAGKAVDDAAKKAGNEIKKAGQAVGNTAKKAGKEVEKAGKAVGDTAKKAGNAIKNLFKK